MKIIKFLLILLCILPPNLSAQTTRKITFQVSWRENADSYGSNDSTLIQVFASNDTIPVLSKFRKTSPDTISLPAPGDSITYSFKFTAYRRKFVSSPGTGKFYFDAAKYFRILRYVAEISNPPNPSCIMFMFNDSTFVMRNKEAVLPECQSSYSKIPTEYRVTTGYKQRKIETACILQDNESVGCTQSFIMGLFSVPYLNLPVECGLAKNTDVQCVALTTVMDFKGLYSNQYLLGETCFGQPVTIVQDIIINGIYYLQYSCSKSGWEYPQGKFPGRIETSYAWIFFYKPY